MRLFPGIDPLNIRHDTTRPRTPPRRIALVPARQYHLINQQI